MEHSSDHLLSGPSEISVDIPKNVGETACEITTRLGAYCTSNDATLFSSSLPILSHDKLNVNGVEHGCQCTNDTSSELDTIHQDLEVSDTLEEDGAHVIGSLLPDDEDELLAGIMDDFDLSGLTSHTDDAEECDLFGNVGGMELENDPSESLMMAFAKATLSDDVTGNGMVQCGISNAVGTVAGEHPYGEHPSRTLFVRNINSNIEDSELKNLFEQYGDIRTLYTSCKHRGFVMISYYDIRAARTALRALQNKQLRRRKLDIHFSIPKDNPSDKDINQGTLVVFNLDPSVSNDDLRQIFGAYGEIKEIRETPHKRHHKFIEFYDVRAAEAALRELNRSDIAGKRIKLEPSRPGGARRNLMLHPNQELEQDDSRSSWHPVGSPLADSPPGIWGAQYSSPIDSVSLCNLSKSPGFGTASRMTGDLPGLASILHPQVMAAPIGRDHGQGGNHMEDLLTGTNIKCPAFQQSHSLPEPNFSQHSTVPVSSFGGSGSNGSFIESLSGQQFLWGSPDPYLERSGSPTWPRPSMGHPFAANGRRGTFLTSAHHPHHNQYHHVGSAPSPSSVPLERRFGFSQEFSETSFVNPLPFGGSGLGHNGRNYMVNMDSRAAINGGVAVSGKMPENSSPSFRMMSPSRLGPMFLGGGLYPGLVAAGKEGLIERGRNRRMENNGHVIDGKKQFQLDLDNITNGEDNRTTLMIKNIPNKYTSKMLLATIDELNRGTYDFLYLPIDFKNKCNVGYAFINMLSPKHIIPFYAAFNGKKWEKFNSEKVASLAYARIQGKAALVAHFQNSSLMNEDKRCRPILFYSEGGDQEHLPSNSLNIVQVSQSNESESDGSPGILGE